ncbi:hypothetical protein GE061_019619 [Apolygus lucorum]|uniref:HTH psq-type domain-containing protein n=1 Tax=Apolygus lucorum TaxID=248454 RepID=A0A8S9X8X5_APOLU|nr:hypothetical protein GE061_019619 [Apolygus lucorum]
MDAELNITVFQSEGARVGITEPAPVQRKITVHDEVPILSETTKIMAKRNNREAYKMVLTQRLARKKASNTPIGKKSKKSSFIPRKQYEEGEMMAAIDAVKNGMPVATAARTHGVPRVTLMYKASAITYPTVANGFRKCGLYPWDQNALPLFSENISSSSSDKKAFDSKEVLLGLSVLEHFMGEENVKKFKRSPSGTENIADESLFRVWNKMRSFFGNPINQELPPAQQEEVRVLDFQNSDEIVIDDPATVTLPQENDQAIISAPQEDDPALASTPQKVPSTTRSDQHQLITVQAAVHAPNNLPSPFKKALIWPEVIKNTVNNKRKKEVLPSVVTSSDYKLYLKNKIEKKVLAEENKKARAAQRAKKRTEREMTKLQQVAERERKKAQAKKKKETQPKKQKKTAAKKAKHAEETSSSEEDEWQPDDESDDGEISIDESDNVDLGELANDARIEKSNHPITRCDETEEMREEIIESIQEILYGPDNRSPPSYEGISEGNTGSFSTNVDNMNARIAQEPSIIKHDSINAIQEEDFVTVTLKNKKKVVACQIFKIDGKLAMGYCLTPCNRMKTVFTIDPNEEIVVEEEDIVTKLPKPLLFGNNKNGRLLFPQSIKIS